MIRGRNIRSAAMDVRLITIIPLWAKESPLVIVPETDTYHILPKEGFYPEDIIEALGIPQHLNFMCDDEVKPGDWFYISRMKIIAQATDVYPMNRDSGWYKKVVATTNPDINLPRPSEEFVKIYANANGIKEVKMEFEFNDKCKLHDNGCVIIYNYIDGYYNSTYK